MKYLLIALVLMGAGCEVPKCLKWEEYEYYSTQGTALWIATKNAGFLAQNGMKKGERCVEYAPSN